MPRIKVKVPADAAIVANPREFALLAELAPVKGAGAGDVQVESEAVLGLAKQLGGDVEAAMKLVSSGQNLSFEDFAAAFKREGLTPQVEGAGNCIGYAARDKSGVLSPFKFERRAPGPKDIAIKITHCGMCHSDLHQVCGEWGNSSWPMVPGHEVAGVVTAVGKEVRKLKVGDWAGVGCMVDSCRKCPRCAKGEEQYCATGMVATYNGKDAAGAATQGGYSTHIVVDEAFVLAMPRSVPLDRAAPLLCAGITVWSPMRHYGLDKKGMKIGVNGLGGLGHMAVKFGVALGMHVTVISRSRAKFAEAKALGAHAYLVSSDPDSMAAAAGSLAGIIDTVSDTHDVAALMGLLDVDGTVAWVGAPAAGAVMPIPYFNLLFKRQKIGGSLIGGIKETQEMLDFCGKHGIGADVEVVAMKDVNSAMERLRKGDVKFRFVIDVQGTLG